MADLNADELAARRNVAWEARVRRAEAVGRVARYCWRLLRVARRLDAMVGRVPDLPHLGYSDLAEVLREVVHRRDDGLHGAALVARALRLADGRPKPVVLPDVPDQRPGCYYVSAIDGPRRWLVAGPWDSHSAALRWVDDVRSYAGTRDPRAAFMAWGTARSDEPQPTLLGEWPARSSRRDPDAEADEAPLRGLAVRP